MDEIDLISIGFWESLRLGSRDRIKMVCKLAHRGDYIHTSLGTYYFNRPDAILHVLQTHADCFAKQHTPYDQMMAALGPGLITFDGKNWAQSRQRLQQHFNTKAIEKRLSLATPGIVNQLTKQPQGAFDLMPMVHQIVTEAMLHMLCDFTSPDLIKKACEAISLSNVEVSKFAPWNRPIPKRKKLQKALRELDDAIEENLEKFSNDGLLGPVIEEYQQQQMPKEHFLGEMKNFFIASAETTASTLAWAIYNITAHPDVWAKISHEIRRSPIPKQWCSPHLPYTQQCIEETLRLYPSIWTILRRSTKRSHLGNIHIDKNQIIILSPYTLHRHPDYWDTPEQFNPDNFCPEQKQKRPKGAYIPFGMGKRICIGKQLAMATMKCILYEWISRYDLQQPRIQWPGLLPLVSLQPKDPIMIQAKQLD